MPNSQIKYFKNLDAIRFIAALFVFCQHGFLNSFTNLKIESQFLQRVIHLFCNGGTGVSLFFVLSGFLITYLLINEANSNDEVNIKYFYFRRILRIWPLYFTVVIFAFIFYPTIKEFLGINQQLASNIYYHLIFLSNFDVINVLKYGNGMNAMSQNITWSVSIEEQFYFFWPLIFLLPKKLWHFIMVSIILLSLGFRIYNNNDYNILYFHTFSVMIDLAMGGLFAYYICSSNKVRIYFENTSTKHHLVLIFITILTLFFHPYLAEIPLFNAIIRLFTGFLFAFFIASQAFTKNKSFLNMYNFKFATSLGKYTYGIYLLHPICLLIVDILLRTLKFNYKEHFITYFLAGILSFILTLAVSILSYKYFESYFLQLKSKYTVLKSNTN